MRTFLRGQAALLGVGVLLLCLSVMSPAAAKLPVFEPGETVAVESVGDGGLARLSDGRSLVPAGLRLPRAGEPWAEAAREALQKLLLGHPVELRYAGQRQDRHGWAVAQLFVGRRWVQGEMLRRGLARVDGSADERQGLSEMLAREAKARRSRRGLWRDPAYEVRAPAQAGRYAGSFQLVEGRVVAAHRAEGALLLNFAADWRHGFSLRLAPEMLRLMRQERSDPAALAGQSVRVRGFIHGSERPMIDVTYPEQIELLPRERGDP